MFSLNAILKELAKTGHDELWIMTADNGESYRRAPMFPGSWLHPKIVTRDGRVIAERVAKPNGWSLCGDWRNVKVRPGCAAPYLSKPLQKLIHSLREKAVLEAILPGDEYARDNKRL